MASLRQIKGSYFLRFRLAGRQFERDVGQDESRARATKKRVEATLLDIKNGRLRLPDEVDIAQFIISDGEATAKLVLPEVMTLADMFGKYLGELPDGALEANSLMTHRIHQNHLTRLLGARECARGIGTTELQAYVNKRVKEGVQPATIKKEIATFRAVWNWSVSHDLLTGSSPTRGLKYPKGKDKPPFMTWGEIEEIISRGGLTKEQVETLWDCLFLDTDQISDLLAHVKATAHESFVYPMFVFVALTGCRRSEMLRSQREDADDRASKVQIREKKRDRSVKITFRSVDKHPFLAQVMKEWFATHPGGQFTFCRLPHLPLSIDEAWYHFKNTLKGSVWAVVRGFHVFRHSFASNLARAGVDQRVIDEFLGHQTEAMRRRYGHLFPDTKRAAIQAAFGKIAAT